MDKRPEIVVGQSSILNLKGELKRLESLPVQVRKPSNLRLKPSKPLPKATIAHNQLDQEQLQLDKSWRQLERKAKIYQNQEEGAQCMVDFASKPAQTVKGWKEHTDEFGRTRLVPNVVEAPKREVPDSDDSDSDGPAQKHQLGYMNPERQAQLQGNNSNRLAFSHSDSRGSTYEQTNLSSGFINFQRESQKNSETLHFDDTREKRTLGTGFFRFSKDEETRQKQIQDLKDLEQETIANRVVKVDRKAERRAKMLEVQERKKARYQST